jgi:hypothetical protein
MDMKKQNSKAVEDDRLKQMREIVDLNIGDLTVEQLFESLSERTRNVIQNTSKLLDRHYMAREVLLPIARNMAQLEPNREYWTNVETPVQPIGLLPGEAVLRLIVMALPYLLCGRGAVHGLGHGACRRACLPAGVLRRGLLPASCG